MKIGLNSAWLKIIALITMTIDHIGYIIFPEQQIYRYIGRLAFPIFAYLIAEGYTYTRDKKKYFFKMLTMAVLTQIPYVLVQNNWYLNIFWTFTISIVVMYLIDKISEKSDDIIIKLAVIASVYFIGTYIENSIAFKSIGLAIDYKVLGALIPALAYIGKKKSEKIILFSLGLLAVALSGHVHIQIYSMISVLLLMLYNGERGYNAKWFKELFWFYYPVHLGALYLINTII